MKRQDFQVSTMIALLFGYGLYFAYVLVFASNNFKFN